MRERIVQSVGATKMIAGFLCGLFYGAFFLAVHRKAESRRRVDREIARIMQADECGCSECCDCFEDG
jgi:hypothetical protein